MTEDKVKAAKENLASLGRVFHRLALVDSTDRLESVLDKLLPKLLKRIGENHREQQQNAQDASIKALCDQIHAKLVEMMSHVMKRVRNDAKCKLPCAGILELLLDPTNEDKPAPDVHPMTMHLSLTFLALGLPRCTTPQLYALLPNLVACQSIQLGSPSRRSQSNQMAHLLLRCVEGIVREVSSANAKTPPEDETALWLERTRALVRDNEALSATVFDLFLDVLLYQPTPPTSSLPPDGVSQAGHERLKEGNSTAARDWAAEMAPRGRLIQLQLALLEFVSPSRRWALFLSPNTPPRGLSRTLALLAVASGNTASMEVADRAEAFLKMHLDSFRGSSGNGESAAAGSNTSMMGDSTALVSTLLTLCVGQAQSENRNGHHPETGFGSYLGRTNPDDSSPSGLSSQLLMSMKRRPLSDVYCSSIFAFVSSKVLEHQPRIFEPFVSSSKEMAQLIVLAAKRVLSSSVLLSSSGLTKLRAKPYSHATELLNVLTIRLCAPLDTINRRREPMDPFLVDLLCQVFQTTCEALKPVSSSPATRSASSSSSLVTSDGNIAIRDACYGVIGTLCRSSFATLPEGYVFLAGDLQPRSDAIAPSVSVASAALLFGCVANEEERLKPRAVAALDALLGSYSRLLESNFYATSEPKATTSTENPWSTHDSVNDNKDPQPPRAPALKPHLLGALLPLIWTASQNYQPKPSRVAASQWAADLIYQLEEANASHILCFLAGDNDPTTSGIARKGLSLTDDFLTHDYVSMGESSNRKLPDIGRFVSLLFEDSKEKQQSSFRSQSFADFTLKGKAVTLHFAMQCLLNDLYGGSDASVQSLLIVVINILSSLPALGAKSTAAVDLLDECSSCLAALLRASRFAREHFMKGEFGIKKVQELAMSASSSRARKQLASVCGILIEDHDLWTQQHIISAEQSEALQGLFDNCCSNLAGIGNGPVVSSPRIQGSFYLGAYATKASRKLNAKLGNLPSHFFENASIVLQRLGEGCLHVDEIVGNACSDCLSIAFSYDGMDPDPLDLKLVSPGAFVLSKLAFANSKYSSTDSLNPMRVLKSAGASGVCLAATTFSATTQTANGTAISDELLKLDAARQECVDALANLLGSSAFRKEEEVAICAGQALALYADAFNTSEDVSSSGLDWPSGFDEEAARKMIPPEKVLYLLARKMFMSSSPPKQTAVAPALLALTARAAKNVNNDESYRTRCFVQRLLAHLDEIQSVFITLLSHPKSKHLSRESCCLGLAACYGLLSDHHESNDVAHQLNNKLLRAFGQTTSFAGSALVETQEQANERRNADRTDMQIDFTDDPQVEVGGASGIGEAALGAFREMAAASVALDRHDILYALLVLSVSHSFWFTSENRCTFSATALLGSQSLAGESTTFQMQEVLKPYLGKLLPRILRAKNDPNAQTRDQMSTLWAALTGGGSAARSAVTDHLLTTIDVLIKEVSSKLWRVRAGACSALAEVIVGRDWTSLGGGEAVLSDDDLLSPLKATAGIRLLRLWRVSMRALDDVRLPVRENGGALARAVRALTIRLCDPAAVDSDIGSKRDRDGNTRNNAEITAASATALRWLVRHGLNQHSEGAAFCITCLVDVVGLVTPTMLSPILPDLIRSLLVSISGLEPAALNYMQLRTDDQEGLERARLQLASSGPIASAVTKCLELTPATTIDTQQSVVVNLDTALREATGFASRAAIADAVNTLCSSCPMAFRFPGTSSGNPTVRLLRALYHTSERERTAGSRDRLLHSLGSLASVSPGISVRSLALRACQKYASSSGSNDDPIARSAAAACLRSITVRASNHLADGGKSDIWCRRVLPNAFIGRKDENAKIATLWQDVWEEAPSALKSSEQVLVGASPEESLLPYLVTECILGLEDVSWSRRVAASDSLLELCQLGILAPLSISSIRDSSSKKRITQRANCSRIALERSVRVATKPRLWSGKSNLIQALAKIAGNWVNATDDNTDRASTLTSYGEKEAISPPIIFRPTSINDLFQDDGWFQSNNNVADETADTDEVAADEGTIGEMEESNDNNAEDIEDSEMEVEELMQDVSYLHFSAKPIAFTGLCRLLLLSATKAGQDSDKNHNILPYRKACFDGLKELLSKLPSDANDLRTIAYEVLSPPLFDMISRQSPQHPPVLIAAAFGCLASLIPDGIGSDETKSTLTFLVGMVAEAGGEKQSAWTVREASTACLASIVTRCDSESFRKYEMVSSLVDSAIFAISDRKFWRVRFAGLSILDKLARRASEEHGKGNQVVLESLLPHKERMSRLVKSCLRDSEAEVTALATNTLSSLAWWP